MSDHNVDETESGRTDRPESRITTDRDQIRRWADERGSVPASQEGTEGDEEYRFFSQGAVEEGYRERDWNEFFDHFESEEQALLYRDEETGEGVGHHELIDRDEAAARATVEDRDAEQRLLDGETVRTEVTETTVVEREIVETERIESEVVDTESVRGRITDAELVDWEVLDTDADVDLRAADDIVGRDLDVTGDEGAVRYDDLDLDTRIDGDFEAEIAETWRVRREVDERATVESEVVDTDVEEHDRVEDDDVSIDVEGVQRSIVEGGVLDVGTGTRADADPVDRGAIETEQLDAGRLRSRLVQRKTYEDRIRRRKRLRFDFVDSELIDTETLDSELVESEIAEVDAGEGDGRAATAGAGPASATAPTTDAETDTDTADAEPNVGADAGTVDDTRGSSGTVDDDRTNDDGPLGDDRESDAGTAAAEHGDPTDDTGTIGDANDVEAANESADRDAAGTEGTRRDLTSDEQGKTVTDETGEEIGVVSRVENGTAYVDPHPGFLKRIGAKLGWSSRDEGEQPLEAEHVNEIDRDRVIVDAAAEAEIEEDDADDRR